MTGPELWAPIPEFSGYEASTAGRVRSFRRGRPRVLRPQPVTSGYLKVSLRHGGETQQCLVHRLVALTFLGPANGRWVNHRNGVKTDNGVGNLEWTTPSQNTEHAYRESLQPSRVGVGNGHAKLDEEAVLEIRQQREDGRLIREIAAHHGVSKTAVIEVLQRRSWAHV